MLSRFSSLKNKTARNIEERLIGEFHTSELGLLETGTDTLGLRTSCCKLLAIFVIAECSWWLLETTMKHTVNMIWRNMLCLWYMANE
jgi:hypothetical protein